MIIVIHVDKTIDIEAVTLILFPTMYFNCDKVEKFNNLSTIRNCFPRVLLIAENTTGKAKHIHMVLGISLHKKAKQTYMLAVPIFKILPNSATRKR